MSKQKQKVRKLKKQNDLKIKKLSLEELDPRLPKSKKRLYSNFYSKFCKQFPDIIPETSSRVSVESHLSKIPAHQLHHLVFLHWVSYFVDGGNIDPYMQLYGQKALYEEFTEYMKIVS